MIERGARVYNPYPGMLLERASVDGVIKWLVYWFYIDDASHQFTLREVILQSDPDESSQDYFVRLDNAAQSNLQWIDEEKIKLWMKEVMDPIPTSYPPNDLVTKLVP